MASERKENMEFEAEVRRVAEAIWQLEPGQCQPEHYSSSSVIRELDGIARLRDVTHLLMATTSRRLDKAKEDVRKLCAAARLEYRPGQPTSLWLVTKHQLDAEHIGYARKQSVTVLTLDSFRRRFFDGRDYVSKRRRAAFGSARNLADGTVSVAEDEYVEMPMALTNHLPTADSSSARPATRTTVADMAVRLARGEILVLIGPFGAGKSLTTREVFADLARRYLKDNTTVVPVAINLREHWGQDYGYEMLERHARAIGFSPKENLTIAWRAGLAALLIDGFDEVAAQAVARLENTHFMRQARHQALQGARDLVAQLPGGVGMLICGRDHYFDGPKEMVHALGLAGKRFGIVRLSEFTEDQANQFLGRKGIEQPLPDWLPRKPLILGYLAHHGLLGSILAIDASRGFGYAWSEFIRMICEREASLEWAAMDPETVQRVLERLACHVRRTVSGTGPITGAGLAEAYQVETGQLPGEGVLTQLQRLPGLTEREQDPGARSFIDEDLLAALQGSAVTQYVLGTMTGVDSRGWLSGLPAKATAMAVHQLRTAGADTATVLAAAFRAAGGGDSPSVGRQVAADCVAIALEMFAEEGRADCGGMVLSDVCLEALDLEDMVIQGLHIRDSLVREVALGPLGATSTLRMQGCTIGRVRGAANEQGLPSGMFVGCEVEKYDDLSTNNAVLGGALPPAMKALVVTLRKLYLQPGAGRRVSALKRGIPQGPILDAVDSVVRILEAESMVTIANQVVHPIRRQASRVHQILSAPELSDDTIVLRARKI
jgi:hypothetical protein